MQHLLWILIFNLETLLAQNSFAKNLALNLSCQISVNFASKLLRLDTYYKSQATSLHPLRFRVHESQAFLKTQRARCLPDLDLEDFSDAFSASFSDQRQFYIVLSPEILKKGNKKKFCRFQVNSDQLPSSPTSVASWDCTSVSLITRNFNLLVSTPEENISLTYLDFVTPSLRILRAKYTTSGNQQCWKEQLE